MTDGQDEPKTASPEEAGGRSDDSTLPAAAEEKPAAARRFDRRKLIGIALMAVSSVCVCFGQMCWKLWADKYFGYLALGLVLFVASAALMIVAYRFGQLSSLQPVLALNYPLSLIIAHFIFRESIGVTQIIAILLVSAGVILVAGGWRRK